MIWARIFAWMSTVSLVFWLSAGAFVPSPPDPAAALVAVYLDSPNSLPAFEAAVLPLYGRLAIASGEIFLVGADNAGLDRLRSSGLNYEVLDANLQAGGYYLVYRYPPNGTFGPQFGERLFLAPDGTAVIRSSPAMAARLVQAGAEIARLTLTPKPLYPAVVPPRPAVVDPDPLIQAMIDMVEPGVVTTYTGGLSGEWPVQIGGQSYTIPTRHTDSGVPIETATQFVHEHMRELGMDVETHTWDMGRPPNVIGQIDGLSNPEHIFLITAHLDDMPSGPLAPGADDNASGSVAVLVAADILSRYEWDCTLRFVFFTGEEQGLLGSNAYAERSFNLGENILGVLNLDMIAWNSAASSWDIDLHANGMAPSMALAQLFSDVIDAYNLALIPQIVPSGTGASDHASFWLFGYPAILAIEDFNDFNPYYHTPADNLSHLDMAYFTEFVRAAVGSYAHMAGCLIPPDTGTLQGQVTVANLELPLEGAAVSAQNPAGDMFETYTLANGLYTHTLPAGTYTVTAVAEGFEPFTATEVSILTSTVTTLDFALTLSDCSPITSTAFTFAPPIPRGGETVHFTATVQGSFPQVYDWDFGDGGLGVGPVVTHSFTESGSYTVTLTATNPCSSGMDSQTLIVQPRLSLMFLPAILRQD